ncbi:MAG TPA: DNA adenine methylase, partial [Bacteroidota bacterium]|nr:DNA adenine methylase [Bacteroidota bacterium]
VNYIGSKLRLSPFIRHTIYSVTGPTKDKVFAELFGGTGIVARRFKNDVKTLIVNDIEPYSYTLLRNYIGNTCLFDHHTLIAELNALEGTEGFIFREYCMGGRAGRQYFSDENGRKIDAIRMRIEEWRKTNRITLDEYYFLLATLLENADRVANTAVIYGAFLKHLKKTAQRTLHLRPAVFSETKTPTHVFCKDANELIGEISGDILYLDPPYNARQYGANYHLLNTIALYDKFIPRGRTGQRAYYRSPYCRRRKALGAFEDLVKRADFEFIFMSYNNEGIMSARDVCAVMSQFGTYSSVQRVYQRFKADKTANRRHKAVSTLEHLHILLKS